LTWAAAAFLVVGFLVLLQLQRVPAYVTEIGTTSQAALRTLRDATASDAEKELRMRQSSLRLFALAGRITLATLIALAVPTGLLALLAAGELVDFEAVLLHTLSWQILLGGTLLGLLCMRLLRRR
jgi:hypothetical protein